MVSDFLQVFHALDRFPIENTEQRGGYKVSCDSNVDRNCATHEATESAKFASEKHFLGESGNTWGLVG